MKKNNLSVRKIYAQIFNFCMRSGYIKKLEMSLKVSESARFNSKKIHQEGLDVLDAVHCVADHKRTILLLNEVKNIVKPNDIVVEAGIGTGILSFMASMNGAKVIGIEINKNILLLAEKIRKDIDKNLSKIKSEILFIHKNAFKFKSKEKFDVIISENLYTGMFYEKQVQIMNNLVKFLKPGGKTIPSGLRMGLTLINITSSNKFKQKEMYVVLDHPELKFSKLSSDLIYETLDFSKENKEFLDVKITAPVTKSGEVNAVLIWSEVLLPSGKIIKRTDTTFLNNDIILTLKEKTQVVAGKKTFIHIQYKYGSAPKKANIAITS